MSAGLDSEPRSAPIFRSLDELPAGFGPTVASIGNFDGVHCGHRAILNDAIAEARSTGLQCVAVTFHPHPEQFLRPSHAPKLIIPPEVRFRLLAASGVDAVLVLPFDQKLAHIPAREFAQQVLAGRLRVRSLYEGHNFRFGHRAAAGVEELTEMGAELGFAVHVHSLVFSRGVDISSTNIRKMVNSGDMRRARWMLGRPFALYSAQMRDRGIGSRLVVPTINLKETRGVAPGYGVYVTNMKIAGRSFQSVTNVGKRPTFDAAGYSVETHILDFEPVEMDETTPLELDFLHRLRGEKKWPSPEALKQQILKDVARARRFFRLAER